MYLLGFVPLGKRVNIVLKKVSYYRYTTISLSNIVLYFTEL